MLDPLKFLAIQILWIYFKSIINKFEARNHIRFRNLISLHFLLRDHSYMTSRTGEDGGHRVSDILDVFLRGEGQSQIRTSGKIGKGGGVDLDKIWNLNIQTNKKINICLLNFKSLLLLMNFLWNIQIYNVRKFINL